MDEMMEVEWISIWTVPSITSSRPLVMVAAGKLIVVVNGDGDRTAGLLFNVLLKEVCADAVICSVGLAVAGQVDADLIVLAAVSVAAAVVGIVAAGTQCEDHAQCEND